MVTTSQLLCISVPRVCFTFKSGADSGDRPHYVKFHLGLHCLAKYFLGISSTQTVERYLRKPQCGFLNVIQSCLLVNETVLLSTHNVRFFYTHS